MNRGGRLGSCRYSGKAYEAADSPPDYMAPSIMALGAVKDQAKRQVVRGSGMAPTPASTDGRMEGQTDRYGTRLLYQMLSHLRGGGHIGGMGWYTVTRHQTEGRPRQLIHPFPQSECSLNLD